MRKNLQTTVYTPESSLSNPVKMIPEMFRDLYESRELAWRLAVRDISAQYRQSFLGFLWALILPLANTVVWIFLSKSGIVVVSETDIPYPIYVFTGTMLWGIFMESVNSPLQGTNSAKPMLAKINFPREAIIVSGFYQILFNSSIKIFLVLTAVMLMGIMPGWGVLMIPVGILSIVLIGMTIGIFITPIGMLYGDIGRGMGLLMQFLMYVTPVVFPIPPSGVAAALFSINPMTPVIQTGRAWMTGQTPDMINYFIVVNGVAGIMLLFVWMVYRLAMPILIERMSS
jgi:lipopolysaccharide transport system permease protein